MENTAEFSDQNSVQFTSTCPSAVSSPHVNPRGSGKRKQSLQPGGLGAKLGYSCALGDPLAVTAEDIKLAFLSSCQHFKN